MFDPYLQWLQIPAERRPPNHYELLGLPEFESDAQRIHQAAMERMTLVRRYQLGEHSELVIRLLGELSAAFDCLSDPQRRAAYDEQLRTQPPAAVIPATPAANSVRPLRRSPSRLIWLVGGTIAAAVVAWAIWPPADSATRTETTSRHPTQVSLTESGTDGNASGNTATADPRQTDSPIRYFGYSTAGPGTVMPQIARYTNVVMVRNWVDRGPGVIAAAKEAGLPVVLCVQAKEKDNLLKRLPAVMEQHGDAVLAVCWFHPYLTGFKPADVANFGRRLKGRHPKVQYWICSMVDARGKADSMVVPPEVDVLVVHEFFDGTADAVHARADAELPAWRAKLNDRPIVLCWASQARGKELVPSMELGTFRACVDVAKQYGLVGVFFDRYGDINDRERPPIESRPELENEIRELAHELGFDRKQAEVRPVETRSGAP